MLTIILAMMLDIGQLKHQADMIELNTKYDCTGEVAFVQVILYEWSHDYRRFDVARWYIVDAFAEYPKRIGSRWHTKQFTAPIFRKTQTLHDPERANQKLRPRETRRAYDRLDSTSVLHN